MRITTLCVGALLTLLTSPTARSEEQPSGPYAIRWLVSQAESSVVVPAMALAPSETAADEAPGAAPRQPAPTTVAPLAGLPLPITLPLPINEQPATADEPTPVETVGSLAASAPAAAAQQEGVAATVATPATEPAPTSRAITPVADTAASVVAAPATDAATQPVTDTDTDTEELVGPADLIARQTTPTPSAAPSVADSSFERFATGRGWTLRPVDGARRDLSAILSDAASERRPAGWNPLYRSGQIPQSVQFIGEDTAGQPVASGVVATSYAASNAHSAAGSYYAPAGCNEGCCPTDCGCETCCAPTCCCPVWSVGVDAMFLSRNSPDIGGKPLVRCNCPDLDRRFYANDYDPGIAAGPRFRLYRHCPCQPGLEISYFNIDGWNDYRRFTGDISVFGRNIGPNGVATAEFDSQLQMLEINVTRDHGPWTKWITGFRWAQLDEFARVSGTGAATISRSANVTNDLYGGHVGCRRLLYDYGGCLTLDSTVKAGVYGNDIDRTTNGYGVRNLSDTGVSFIGDVEFQANFEVTCHCTFTAGYQLLWLTGIASAPEQFGAGSYINTGDTLFLHGATVGMVYSW